MQDLMKQNGDADTAKRIVYVWLVLEKKTDSRFLVIWKMNILVHTVHWLNWWRMKIFIQSIPCKTEISILVCEKSDPKRTVKELPFLSKSPQITNSGRSNIISVANICWLFIHMNVYFFQISLSEKDAV